MCALSLRADIDGRDSLDGYRNRSRYYQGIAHEVPIRAVAATVMSVRAFSTDSSGIVGRLMSASARKRRTGAEPEALRLAGLP
jgi:hypothetical protein